MKMHYYLLMSPKKDGEGGGGGNDDPPGKKKGEEGGGAEDDDDPDDEEGEDDPPGEEDPAKLKAEVKRLRDENAKARVKNKDLESKYTGLNDRFGKLEGGLKKLFGDGGDDLPPEKKIEQLSQKNEALALSAALKDAALEHGVGKDAYEYFEFLVQKEMQGLKDDEELSEETLAAIAKKAKGKSAPKSTSVDEDVIDKDPSDDDDEISLAEFAEMKINARSNLYSKNKALYEKLVAQERQAKKKAGSKHLNA